MGDYLLVLFVDFWLKADPVLVIVEKENKERDNVDGDVADVAGDSGEEL